MFSYNPVNWPFKPSEFRNIPYPKSRKFSCALMKEKTDSKDESLRSPSAAEHRKSDLPPAPTETESEPKPGLSCLKRFPSYLQLLRVLQAEERNSSPAPCSPASII